MGALTFHRLLQELCDLVHVLGVQGGGKDKLALRLHEVLPEQLPAPGQGLTYQGLRAQGEEGKSLCKQRETGSTWVTGHTELTAYRKPRGEEPG